MPNEHQVEVQFTPEFKRNVRQLAKKYRSIKSDLQPVIDQLERGDTPGDQIQRTGFTVYKVRVQNTDLKKGKRSGYRVVYYIRTPDKVILVTIYSKTEQGDISPEEIRKIIAEHDSQGHT